MAAGQLGMAVKNHFITLDGHHFTGVLIHEVFRPAAEHAGSQAATRYGATLTARGAAAPGRGTR